MEYNYDNLKNVPLFNGIDEIELDRILHCLGAYIKEYKKNHTVFWEDEPAEYIGIVLSGKVLMTSVDYNGNRNILSYAYTNDIFCESFACAELDALPISVIACEKSKIMFIKCSKLQSPCMKACTCHSRIIHNLLYIVAKNNISLNNKIELTSKRTTKEKLMAYLYFEAKRAGNNTFTIPYNRQELADYLGVERSAMSSEIGKLIKEGYILTTRSHFTVLI